MLYRNIALEAVRVTEAAAMAAARIMGRGDNIRADMLAVQAMREALDTVNFRGRIVIGEGEKDDSPVLFSGEVVGRADEPVVDLAVDALEGPTIVATGGTNALSVLAVGEEGSFFRTPDTYMDKIAVGAGAAGVIDISKPPSENLEAISSALERPVEEITVVILDRPRHEKLIDEVRKTGAMIRLISDGDVAAAIATAGEDTGVDVLMGTGGASEGVLAAAALRCMGGNFQGILRPRNREEIQRARRMGIRNVDRVLAMEDLARGNIMFAATGVTDGELLKGVRFFKGGAKTSSLVLRSQPNTIRYLQTTHFAID
ncbi:MAG: class II fructose-bisphosphatase [Deltaproteobacteria bacterium]|nr:class II fructose-bisphosphatase [Deltaproteobacteria bacterium]NIS76957.1 class II fructose-bisphosphatase [Deltaproteobacteria bacterium]